MAHAQTGETSSRHHFGLTATLLTLSTVALWGGTPVAIRFTVGPLPVVFVAGVRFLLATLFLFIWCRIQGASLAISREQQKPVLILGVMLFVQISTFNLGIHWANASHGTLFINTFIFWVIAIDHFVTRINRLNARKFAGLIVAAAGVALILQVDQVSLVGDLILLLSALLLGIKILYTKSATELMPPGTVIFWHNVIGVVLFFSWSFCFEDINLSNVDGPVVWGLLYQGLVVAGYCFAMQAELLKRYPASQISVFSFATPLFGITYAILIAGEPFTYWLVVAGVLVALGILLVNWPSRSIDVDSTSPNAKNASEGDPSETFDVAPEH